MNIVKFLPSALSRRIEQHPVLHQALSNISWVLLDKILRMGLGIVVGFWVARHLGPDGFGQFNYALAAVSLAYPLANFGLTSIVVRDLLKAPESAHETLGGAFVVQIAGSLAAIAILLGTVHLFQADNKPLIALVAIMGASLPFKSAEVVKCWFESQMLSRFTVIAENAAFLVCTIARMALIALDASLTAFAWLFLIEAALSAAALGIVYSRHATLGAPWRASWRRVQSLLADSWPLLLSSLTVMIYMRIDQIMLGELLGNEAVGIYSAAIRISEVWYFIPTAIVSSLYPAIMKARHSSLALYHRRLHQLFTLVVWLALSVALPATLLSSPLTGLVYGEAFSEAGAVLAVHIWTAPFVFLGVASHIWYVSENLQFLAFMRTFLGAIINILANYVLIPRYGTLGAAIGTLLAQAFAAYAFDAFHPRTRHIFKLKSSTIIPHPRLYAQGNK